MAGLQSKGHPVLQEIRSIHLSMQRSWPLEHLPRRPPTRRRSKHSGLDGVSTEVVTISEILGYPSLEALNITLDQNLEIIDQSFDI